jgi:transcription termination/antitermination protein NusG
MERWYVVHTKLHQERRVAAVLERHEIETFLPMLVHPNREPASPVAFFPGYFFMRVDYASTNSALWRWSPGFRYVVSAGEQPIPILDEVVAMIAHRLEVLAEQGDGRQQRLPFEQGDLVRIKRGPFRDLVGVFDGPNDPQQRVRVLLKTMHRSMRVRVSPDDLEKTDLQDQNKGGRPPRRTRGRGRPIRSRS